MLIALVKGVDASVKMIWEAIKSGKIEGIADAIKKEFENAIVDSVKTIDNLKNEVKKRVGKVAFHEIEVDGIKVPVGLEIEGLQKERASAFGAVREGMKQIGQGFKQFKADKLLKFQFEDASELFMDVWQNLVTPFLFPKQAVEQLGTAAGSTFNQAFDKEFKKVEAVLFSSTEALSRMAEYRERLPNVVKKTDVKQMVMAQQPPVQPNRAEEETVNLLKRLVDLAQIEANKQPVQIVPADLP